MKNAKLSISVRISPKVVKYWKRLAKDNGYKYTALMSKALSHVVK